MRSTTTRLALLLLLACVPFASGQTTQTQEQQKQQAQPTQAEGWAIATPDRKLTLPADHASHPDYKIEWWYYTGNLDTREGRRYGYQLTFFRVGVNRTPPNASRWAVRDLHMAHFAVSDLKSGKFHVFDRLQREGAGWAGAATNRYAIWNGTWSVQANPDGSHRLLARVLGAAADTTDDSRRAKANGEKTDITLDLQLTNTSRAMAHGRGGYSRKGRDEANASSYYSLPHLLSTGSIAIDGRREEVTGESWMDHEFGSSVLEADQVGWDWFGLQLEDGRDLMLYQMRRRDGGRDPFSSGTLITRDGAIVRLTREDYTLEPLETWRSEASGTEYPVRWRVTIPSQKLAFEVRASMNQQELHTPRSTNVTYWEGAVDLIGGVRGRGYMELTGYNGVALSDALK
jgi:predicted secreted hydrolase